MNRKILSNPLLHDRSDVVGLAVSTTKTKLKQYAKYSTTFFEITNKNTVTLI